MKSIEIKGALRQVTGKKECSRLRKKDNVPCTMYGGKENINFYVFANDLRHLIYTSEIYEVHLNIDDKKYTAILKDIQFHPVTDKITHIDFIEVSDDKKITVSVPVRIKGFSKGVQAGGKLYTYMRYLKAKALLKDIPEQVEINVDDLGLGKSIKVSDITIPNVQFVDAPTSAIVSCKYTRVAKGMEIETKTATVAEGTTAEGATTAATASTSTAAPAKDTKEKK